MTGQCQSQTCTRDSDPTAYKIMSPAVQHVHAHHEWHRKSDYLQVGQHR